MTDILTFINSRDVADYLKEQGHKFTPKQIACIIWRNQSATLEQKHAAWMEFLPEFSGTVINRYIADTLCGSIPLDGAVRGLLGEENYLLGLFYSDMGGGVYSFGVRYLSDERVCEDDRIFFSLNECLAVIEEEYSDILQEVGQFVVRKRFTGKNGRTIRVAMNGQRQVMTVSGNDGTYADWLNGIWVNLPTPFKRGDIVCSGAHGEPFVLIGLSVWNGEEVKANGGIYAETNDSYADKLIEYYQRAGDGSDMFGNGWFFGEDGSLCWDHVPYCYDFQYYRGGFQGINRCLPVLSAVVKGQAGADFLLNARDVIVAEERLKCGRERLASACDKDFLKRFGL